MFSNIIADRLTRRDIPTKKTDLSRRPLKENLIIIIPEDKSGCDHLLSLDADVLDAITYASNYFVLLILTNFVEIVLAGSNYILREDKPEIAVLSIAQAIRFNSIKYNRKNNVKNVIHFKDIRNSFPFIPSGLYPTLLLGERQLLKHYVN